MTRHTRVWANLLCAPFMLPGGGTFVVAPDISSQWLYSPAHGAEAEAHDTRTCLDLKINWAARPHWTEASVPEYCWSPLRYYGSSKISWSKIIHLYCFGLTPSFPHSLPHASLPNQHSNHLVWEKDSPHCGHTPGSSHSICAFFLILPQISSTPI